MMTTNITGANITAAAVKLDRALTAAESGDGCCDPVSGYSAPEIVRYLMRTEAGRRAVARRDAAWLADVT